MRGTSIVLDDELVARLAKGAEQAGLPMEVFVTSLLETVLGDLYWEGRLPVLRVAKDAAAVTVEQVDELLNRGAA